MKTSFQLGKFNVEHSSYTSRGPDPTEVINITIKSTENDGWPRARISLFWDTVTLEIFPEKGKEDTSFPAHPHLRDLDELLASKGFPTYSEIEEEADRQASKWDDDPMGHPSQYESVPEELVNRLLQEDEDLSHDLTRKPSGSQT